MMGRWRARSHSRLARALLDGLRQLVAFALAFALVANIWWAHHKFLSTLGSLEPELIALTLVLLGAVALVPFPTNLIGHVPTERAAVLPFIGVFVVILVLFRGRDASRPGFQRENRKEMEDMVTVALVVVAVALTGIGFFGLYRPWQLRWGATPG